jgi:hypothetical protein
MVRAAGDTLVSATVALHVPAGAALRLAVWPNPARGDARLAFHLPTREPAHVDVFDIAGRRVAGADLGLLEPGFHTVAVPGAAALRSGIYLARLVEGAHATVRRFTFLR